MGKREKLPEGMLGPLTTDALERHLQADRNRRMRLYQDHIEGRKTNFRENWEQPTEPPYEPVGEPGMCTSCRAPLRKDGARVYHPIGTVEDSGRCPSGQAPKSEIEDQLEILRAKLMGRSVAWSAPPVDWSTVEIEVPEHCFFSLEYLDG